VTAKQHHRRFRVTATNRELAFFQLGALLATQDEKKIQALLQAFGPWLKELGVVFEETQEEP